MQEFLDMKSPFREDKDIAKTAIFGDIEQAVEFSNKLFKDEEFVYSIMVKYINILTMAILKILENIF